MKTNTLSQKPRIVWLDLLRIFAAISVIFIHVSSDKFFAVAVDSKEFLIFSIYDILSQVAVPLFVMISGAMMLKPDSSTSISEFLKKKLPRLLIPLVFWMTVSGAYDTLIDFKNEHTVSIKMFITNIIGGRQYFWFIFMLAGLYIITPLLRCITERLSLCKYFCTIFLLFSCILPFAIEMIQVFDISALSFVKRYSDYMKFYFPLGFTAYYIAGYYLTKKPLKKTMEIILYISAIVSTIFGLIMTVKISIEKGTAYTYFFQHYAINIYLSSLSIYTFFSKHVSKIQFKNGAKLIAKVSSFTFGTYLCHMYFLYILNYLGINTLSFNAILSVPALSVFLTIISIIVVAVIKKIPILKDYIC